MKRASKRGAEKAEATQQPGKLKKMKLPKPPAVRGKESLHNSKINMRKKSFSPVKIKVVEGRRMFDRSCKNRKQMDNTNKNCSSTVSKASDLENLAIQMPNVTKNLVGIANQSHSNSEAEVEADGLRLTVNASDDEEFGDYDQDSEGENTIENSPVKG